MANFCDYMIQHVLYIKGVENSILKNTQFPHKRPTECAFGKMFYGALKPNIDGYSETKRRLIDEVEQIHIQFHEAARLIHPDDADIERHKSNAWFYSSRLINLLDRLEKLPD